MLVDGSRSSAFAPLVHMDSRLRWLAANSGLQQKRIVGLEATVANLHSMVLALMGSSCIRPMHRNGGQFHRDASLVHAGICADVVAQVSDHVGVGTDVVTQISDHANVGAEVLTQISVSNNAEDGSDVVTQVAVLDHGEVAEHYNSTTALLGQTYCEQLHCELLAGCHQHRECCSG